MRLTHAYLVILGIVLPDFEASSILPSLLFVVVEVITAAVVPLFPTTLPCVSFCIMDVGGAVDDL